MCPKREIAMFLPLFTDTGLSELLVSQLGNMVYYDVQYRKCYRFNLDLMKKKSYHKVASACSIRPGNRAVGNSTLLAKWGTIERGATERRVESSLAYGRRLLFAPMSLILTQ